MKNMHDFIHSLGSTFEPTHHLTHERLKISFMYYKTRLRIWVWSFWFSDFYLHDAWLKFHFSFSFVLFIFRTHPWYIHTTMFFGICHRTPFLFPKHCLMDIILVFFFSFHLFLPFSPFIWRVNIFFFNTSSQGGNLWNSRLTSFLILTTPQHMIFI